MTEDEIYAAVRKATLATTIGVDDFLGRVATNQNYAYKKTQWYAEMKAAENLKTAPLIPPSDLAQLAQHCLYTAWSPEAALNAPASWKVLLSADPAFDQAARAAAPKIRAHGNMLGAWGNQTQIGAQRIKDFAAAVGADFVVYQAETAAEYDSAIAAGAVLIVGNPNAWTAAQRIDATDRVNTGRLAIQFEVYTNEGGPWPNAASSQGVPAASEVLGVGWGRFPYSLADYKANTPAGVWAGMSIYLAEAVQDWQNLP